MQTNPIEKIEYLKVIKGLNIEFKNKAQENLEKVIRELQEKK